MFYGHLVPSHVGHGDPELFTDLTFYHSEHSVLLNTEGRRIYDETVGDHITPMHLLQEDDPRGLLIYDQRVRDQRMRPPYVEGIEPIDKFQLAYRRGARCAVANDLEEFDTEARVLDRDGRPIRGLLAAGADAGGTPHRAYTGGLGMSLVLGRRAAESALAAR